MLTRIGLRLICVDDEQSGLINCKYALTGCADIASAFYFKTVAETIAHVEHNITDIAILDIDLPEMNGFQLADKLTTLCPGIKIVFATGNISYMTDSRGMGNAPCIFKPYSAAEMMDAINRAK